MPKWNPVRREWIEPNEGIRESFCPKCGGCGLVYPKGLWEICKNCNGEGKLDWVKRQMQDIMENMSEEIKGAVDSFVKDRDKN